jgi:hypothetical protein
MVSTIYHTFQFIDEAMGKQSVIDTNFSLVADHSLSLSWGCQYSSHASRGREQNAKVPAFADSRAFLFIYLHSSFCFL